MTGAGRVSRSGLPYQVFDTPAKVARAAARHWVERARIAQARRGVFSVALSGGSTPGALHVLMATPPYRDGLDWSRVEIFFGDDRPVGPDHTDSNFRMANQTLLSHVPLDSERVHRMEGESEDLAAAAERYAAVMDRRLEKNARGFPVIDLSIQGLGPDGHTASLFPKTTALEEMTKSVVANEVPRLKTWRLTMTYPVLNAARSILMLVTGERKAKIVKKIFDADPEERNYPASGIRPEDGELIWMLDTEAASLLK